LLFSECIVYLEAEDYYYAIRLRANKILYKKIEHLLTRPVERPPRKPIVPYESFYYQASSWDKPRRIVAKVEWPADELFPHKMECATIQPVNRCECSILRFFSLSKKI